MDSKRNRVSEVSELSLVGPWTIRLEKKGDTTLERERESTYKVLAGYKDGRTDLSMHVHETFISLLFFFSWARDEMNKKSFLGSKVTIPKFVARSEFLSPDSLVCRPVRASWTYGRRDCFI